MSQSPTEMKWNPCQFSLPLPLVVWCGWVSVFGYGVEHTQLVQESQQLKEDPGEGGAGQLAPRTEK